MRFRRRVCAFLVELANGIDPDNVTCECGHGLNDHLDDGYCPMKGCRCADFVPEGGWPKEDWE